MTSKSVATPFVDTDHLPPFDPVVPSPPVIPTQLPSPNLAPGPPLPHDRHIRRGQDEYWWALSALLPQGIAWPRESDTVLQKVVRGLAGILGYCDWRAADLLERESDPRQTVEMLDSWERAWGLPDPCWYPHKWSIAERQMLLVQRMTILGAQSREFFSNVAVQLGYTILGIREYRPFMVGLDRVGDNRGLVGNWTWDATAPQPPAPPTTYTPNANAFCNATGTTTLIVSGAVGTITIGSTLSGGIGVGAGGAMQPDPPPGNLRPAPPTIPTTPPVTITAQQSGPAGGNGIYTTSVPLTLGNALVMFAAPPGSPPPPPLGMWKTDGDGALGLWPAQMMSPEGRFVWTLRAGLVRLTWFRASKGQAGTDPHLRIARFEDLECIIRRWAPAHTLVLFDYSGVLPYGDPFAGTHTPSEGLTPPALYVTTDPIYTPPPYYAGIQP